MLDTVKAKDKPGRLAVCMNYGPDLCSRDTAMWFPELRAVWNTWLVQVPYQCLKEAPET